MKKLCAFAGDCLSLAAAFGVILYVTFLETCDRYAARGGSEA